MPIRLGLVAVLVAMLGCEKESNSSPLREQHPSPHGTATSAKTIEQRCLAGDPMWCVVLHDAVFRAHIDWGDYDESEGLFSFEEVLAPLFERACSTTTETALVCFLLAPEKWARACEKGNPFACSRDGSSASLDQKASAFATSRCKERAFEYCFFHGAKQAVREDLHAYCAEPSSDKTLCNYFDQVEAPCSEDWVLCMRYGRPSKSEIARYVEYPPLKRQISEQIDDPVD